MLTSLISAMIGSCGNLDRSHTLQRVTSLNGVLIAMVAVGFAKTSSAERQNDRPNILFVMTDDQGYWDTGATGNRNIDTPNIDSLATQGARLDRYYAAPVCAPTRAGIMTGRYYLRTGLYNTRFGGDSLGLDEITVAQCLSDAGYRTGLFGKWHLGKYADYQPQNRGFDEFFGHYHGHIERYQFPDQVFRNGKPTQARGYVTDLFTDAAADFIEHTVSTGEAPFFCALMYNAPHSPFLMDTSHYDQPDGDKGIQKYLDRGLPIREARIYAMVDRIDQNLGRLLGKLDQWNISDKTMVVFTSDNGGVSKFFKAGLNGNKAGVYEGGVRAPCFVRWPGKISPGQAVTSQTSHVDWLPTFCELADAKLPENRKLDGQSLMERLTGDGHLAHHPYVYHTWDRYQPNADRRWSISDQRWKLLCQIGTDQQPSKTRWRLFDLQQDPGEKRNLSSKHPQHVQRLRKEFLRWFQDVTAGQDYRPVPVPVGHPSENPVELEPSWATCNGEQIRYTFDGYDWDTIDHWNSEGESATWNLDVRRGGDYRIWLSYGCRPLDAGGSLKIRAGASQLRHSVQATATAEQFDLHDAGVIRLDAGPGRLTASVDACPGQELMRLNQIRLEWLKP